MIFIAIYIEIEMIARDQAFPVCIISLIIFRDKLLIDQIFTLFLSLLQFILIATIKLLEGKFTPAKLHHSSLVFIQIDTKFLQA